MAKVRIAAIFSADNFDRWLFGNMLTDDQRREWLALKLNDEVEIEIREHKLTVADAADSFTASRDVSVMSPEVPAVATQIGAQHGEITRQHGCDRIEERQVDANRVQQQHMWAFAINAMIELHSHEGYSRAIGSDSFPPTTTLAHVSITLISEV